jgi:hypothetical protein
MVADSNGYREGPKNLDKELRKAILASDFHILAYSFHIVEFYRTRDSVSHERTFFGKRCRREGERKDHAEESRHGLLAPQSDAAEETERFFRPRGCCETFWVV